MIPNFNEVFFTSVFLIPGFIVHEMIRMLVPVGDTSEGMEILKCLAYSVLNYVLWCWLYLIVFNRYELSSVNFLVSIALVTLLTSIVTGAVVGLIKGKTLIKKFFGFFNIQFQHPIPTAWEYKFNQIKTSKWVVIILKNGNIIRGWYGNASFSSSNVQQKDIYLELAYRNEEDELVEIDRTDGIWINGSEIAAIEFYKDKEQIDE